MSFIENMPCVREMVGSDIEVAMALKGAENWNQTEADWRFLSERSPDLCLVACLDDCVVGTVTAINYDDQLAWIGMMLVEQKSRGRGISKPLLRELMSRLDGCRIIKLDATPEGCPVYRKIGFVEEFEIHRMEADEVLIPSLQRSSALLRRVTFDDVDALARYDENVYGVGRYDLIRYCSSSEPERSWLAEEDGVVVGFALGREGSHGHYIGPVNASSPEISEDLMAAAMSDMGEGRLIVDVHADKEQLKSWLVDAGFRKTRSLYRMCYEKKQPLGALSFQFAIGGPEFG